MTLTVPVSPAFLTTVDRNVDLLPPLSEWTVAQAAEFLEMSEECLNELLDAGAVEYSDGNGCRVIDHDILIEYDRERKRRRAALDEMVRMNQEMGLYDD
jgi:hypothetical protein